MKDLILMMEPQVQECHTVISEIVVRYCLHWKSCNSESSKSVSHASITSTSVLVIFGPKCTRAAPWWVTLSMCRTQ